MSVEVAQAIVEEIESLWALREIPGTIPHLSALHDDLKQVLGQLKDQGYV